MRDRTSNAQDLITAFETYYMIDRPLKYNPAVAREILDAYKWIGPKYKIRLYEEVIRIHPVSLRVLPDMAVLTKAEQTLGRPEVYESPVALLEDKTVGIVAKIPSAEEIPEAIEAERERVRVRARKGNASRYEVWWLRCMEEHGKYKPMPEDFDGKYVDTPVWA